MNLFRSKIFWVAAIALLIPGYCEFKKLTSKYYSDFGNGVVLYADDYVNSGLWVLHCGHSRLISRKPVPVPFAELESTTQFKIWDSPISKADEQPAREALAAITSVPNWYSPLRYRFSSLDDYSNLDSHVFDLIAEHAGRLWAVNVDQSISYYGKFDGFTLYIMPFDPETYRDYDKAFQAAIKSCPAPQ